MRGLLFVLLVNYIFWFSINTIYAMEPSDLRGMLPEDMHLINNNEGEQNRLMLELIKERNRQNQYREQNPFGQCISMGEVTGKNIEETKSLARQIGATNIQYLQTTTTFVRAMAYKCPTK